MGFLSCCSFNYYASNDAQQHNYMYYIHIIYLIYINYHLMIHIKLNIFS